MRDRAEEIKNIPYISAGMNDFFNVARIPLYKVRNEHSTYANVRWTVALRLEMAQPLQRFQQFIIAVQVSGMQGSEDLFNDSFNLVLKRDTDFYWTKEKCVFTLVVLFT